jgi:hypothetical protein
MTDRELMEKILEKVTATDSRLSHLETKVDTLDSKLAQVETKVDTLDSKLDRVETRVNQLPATGDILGMAEGIQKEVAKINTRILTVERVTAQNWNDIIELKKA